MWWPFRKKQVNEEKSDPNIERVVNYAGNYVVSHLEKQGLISLYVAGTILTSDRTPLSDIDLFGIVKDNFDFEIEKTINDEFKHQRDTLCDGFSIKFRAIPLESLKGGEQKGAIQYFNPSLFVKKIPFFKLFWGEKLNPDTDFDVQPLSLKEEAEHLIKQVKYGIIDLRGEREKFHYWDFPKKVLELIAVEAQHDYNFKYNPSYKKLANHLRKKKDHLVHKAIQLRYNPDTTRQDILNFCNDTELYVQDLQNRMAEW